MPNLITAEEFAKETGHGLRTVRRWIARDEIPVHREGRNVLIDLAVGLAWLESRQSSTDTVHEVQARRWTLRRHRLEGNGLADPEQVTVEARKLIEHYDRMFGAGLVDSIAWQVTHEESPAIIVNVITDGLYWSVETIRQAATASVKRLTPNPEIVEIDRRIEALAVEDLSPRERCERARVAYIELTNQVEGGDMIHVDRVAGAFHQAGIACNLQARAIGRRLAVDICTQTDQPTIAGWLAAEVQRVRKAIIAELTLDGLVTV